MNFKNIEIPIERSKSNSKLVILLYNDMEFKIVFDKKYVKSITLSNYLIITTNTIYKELLDNKLSEIDNDIIAIKDDKLTDKNIIRSKLKLLREIIESFSFDKLSKDYNLSIFVETIPFFVNLKLISLSHIILKLLHINLTEKKLFILSKEEKVKIYNSINQTISVVLEKISFANLISNQQLLNSFFGVFKESIIILISILNIIKKVELELFLDTFKKEYLFNKKEFSEDIKFKTFALPRNEFFLVINIVRIVILSLINNRELTIYEKLEILEDLVINNNKVIKIKIRDNSENYSFVEMSHEMLAFFDKNIYSSIFTYTYNQNVIQSEYEHLIQIIKIIIDINNDSEELLYLDSISLAIKIIKSNILFENANFSIQQQLIKQSNILDNQNYNTQESNGQISIKLGKLINSSIEQQQDSEQSSIQESHKSNEKLYNELGKYCFLFKIIISLR